MNSNDSKNFILEEKEKSRGYMLDTFIDKKGNVLVTLSQDNVARVEAMISNDTAYLRSADRNAEPVCKKDKKGEIHEKKHGSTAYWFTQMKELLDGRGKSSGGYFFEQIIEKVIKSIDVENSTHINSDGMGYKEIQKCLTNYKSAQNIYDIFKENKGLDLFKELAREISRTDGKKGRENVSFASKFCHYACFYLFEGEEMQDSYPIYDGILRTVLTFYADEFGVNYKNITNYERYMEIIDEVITKSNSKISKNGFDHLIWYYHKGRLSELKNNGKKAGKQ